MYIYVINFWVKMPHLFLIDPLIVFSNASIIDLFVLANLLSLIVHADAHTLKGRGRGGNLTLISTSINKLS